MVLRLVMSVALMLVYLVSLLRFTGRLGEVRSDREAFACAMIGLVSMVLAVTVVMSQLRLP